MARRRQPAAEGFVLPRILRRPARLYARLTSGEVEFPPFAATLMSAALLGAFSLYGAILGGHLPSVVQATTARTGFAITDIDVTGNQETSEIDILDSVGLNGWTSLVGFDPDEARRRIDSLPWVESVSVRKVYPSTLEVKIVEKKPFAIWQHGDRLSLIERNGDVIAPLSGSRYLALPLVVGMGASERAAAFVAEVEQHAELAARIRGYVRVSDRRWNLRLENGVTIKLPEYETEAAILDLIELDREHGVLSRDIVSVDLRLEDRLTVRLSPEAAMAREAAMKEKLGKDYRPAERET